MILFSSFSSPEMHQIDKIIFLRVFMGMKG